MQMRCGCRPVLLPALSLTLGLCLAGCQSKSNSGHVATSAASPAAPAAAGATSPIDDYRAARRKAAMRGLRYDTGFVTIHVEEAAQIVSGRDPAASAAAIAEGHALLEEGQQVGAIAAMTRAVLLAPEEPAAYDALGDVLTFKGRVEEAAAAFRTSLRLDPARTETRVRLANAQQMLNEFDAAIESWQMVLRDTPNDSLPHTRVAILHYYQGDFAAAWKHVHAAEALGGSVPPQFRPLLAERMAEPG